MIYKAHKIELRPTPVQENYLMQAVGARRFIYNYFLNEIKEEWEQGIKYCGKAELGRRFVAIRNSEGREWLLALSAAGVRCAIFDLDTSMQRAMKGLSGFPQFKRRGERDSFSLRDKTKFKINGRSLKIEKLKTTILMRQKLRFEGTPKSITISRKADKWFVSIMVEMEEEVEAPTPPRKPSVGVDLGIKELAVLSDGTVFPANQPLKRHLHKLAKLQKKLAGQVKGSNRREKTKRKIAKCHYYIAQKRKATLHGLTTFLVRNYQRIAIEDLNVAGMVKNRRLARAISDCGFGELRRQLEYKAQWYGNEIAVVPRFYPSSQLCSGCGHRQKMPLKVRVYDCPQCGISIDRDLNAAININNHVATNSGETLNAQGREMHRKGAPAKDRCEQPQTVG